MPQRKLRPPADELFELLQRLVDRAMLGQLDGEVVTTQFRVGLKAKPDAIMLDRASVIALAGEDIGEIDVGIAVIGFALQSFLVPVLSGGEIASLVMEVADVVVSQRLPGFDLDLCLQMSQGAAEVTAIEIDLREHAVGDVVVL